MMLTCPYFQSRIEVGEGETFSLTVENPDLFRALLTDFHRMMAGEHGESVLSYRYKPVPFAKHADVLENFAPFDSNTKAMVSRIIAAMEQTAADPDHYMTTSQLLANIENYIGDLCFSFPLRIECRKLNVGTLIKSLSPAVVDDAIAPIETILSYMTMLSDLDRAKLFIAVHMRSFFTDREMESFIDEVRKKQFRVLLLESSSRPLLPGMKHLTIDQDRCEI